jgi:ubiquinone biosynthesis protein
MTMEHSHGHRIDSAHPRKCTPRLRLADNLMRLLLVRILEHGFFQGDPHPGNIFVRDDGCVCYHDFGIMGE